jgi:acetyltransferase-like isoleucine patch superfamily enzyme
MGQSNSLVKSYLKELEYMNIIKGKNVIINEGCHIGNNVVIEDDVFLDYNCIIRDNVIIKRGAFIGAGCILGENLMDFYKDRKAIKHPLTIGERAIIRSNCVVYGDTIIGDDFTCGHNVTIREKSRIGNHVSIGTLSDIQGNCNIGNFVRIHSNVHIGQLTSIEDFVWIFPYVVITNDPTPPSDQSLGVHIKSFAVISTGSILLPGITIEEDTLIAAGAIVRKDVKKFSVVGGNPAIEISDVRNIKNKFTGESAYPWRYMFKRSMPWEDSDFDTWNNSYVKGNT